MGINKYTVHLIFMHFPREIRDLAPCVLSVLDNSQLTDKPHVYCNERYGLNIGGGTYFSIGYERPRLNYRFELIRNVGEVSRNPVECEYYLQFDWEPVTENEVSLLTTAFKKHNFEILHS